MTTTERKNRIIARGEFSNHAHVITGDATITRNPSGEILIEVGNEGAVLRHILETDWLKGKETWTKEHKDIDLSGNDSKVEIGQLIGRHGDVALEKVADRTYKYIHQKVFDPLTKRIEEAGD